MIYLAVVVGSRPVGKRVRHNGLSLTWASISAASSVPPLHVINGTSRSRLAPAETAGVLEQRSYSSLIVPVAMRAGRWTAAVVAANARVRGPGGFVPAVTADPDGGSCATRVIRMAGQMREGGVWGIDDVPRQAGRLRS